MTTAWVGVASREHVAAAVQGGFCQINHGREAPLRRLQPGDHIVYYAPRERMRGGDVVQAFVALGKILPREPYRADASKGFRPFRRDVEYHASTDAPIRPLLKKLSFTRDRVSWGQALRRGTFRIEPDDLEVIANAMKIAVTWCPVPRAHRVAQATYWEQTSGIVTLASFTCQPRDALVSRRH